jgi:hypothetical protein
LIMLFSLLDIGIFKENLCTNIITKLIHMKTNKFSLKQGASHKDCIR